MRVEKKKSIGVKWLLGNAIGFSQELIESICVQDVNSGVEPHNCEVAFDVDSVNSSSK